MTKKTCVFILLVLFCTSIFANTSRLDTFQFGQERPRIGVVLSGGGAKGIAHVGTLRMLEKLNIPIDYIAGTSMGAVVGALYAMGYTADQIDTIVRVTDWMSLFNDTPDREHIRVFDRKQNDNYQLRISFNPRNITQLPRGMIEGQHIDNMLTHYLFESYRVSSFSDLTIPFFAVATDLIAAEYVVFDSGNLMHAVRASMAVPGVFSPIEINGQLLVDGGVLNNFPVLEMRQRGVDIIIGVNVGWHYGDIDELQSVMQVIEQVVFMGAQWLNNRNKEAADILITPDLGKFTAMSFANADSILQRGYDAAQKAYPELRRLADLLSERFDIEPFNREPYLQNEIIIIDTIILQGNRQYSDNFILQNLRIVTQEPVSVRGIEEAIQRLFGTRWFTKITYHFSLLSEEPRVKALHIDVQEAPPAEARLGFRYDDIRGSALLAGVTFRHVLLRDSEFHANLNLSTLPILDLQYRFSPTISRRPQRYSAFRPTFFLSYMLCNLRFYEYDIEHREEGTLPYTVTVRNVQYGMTGHRFAIGKEVNFGRNVLGLGFFWDITRAREHVGGTGAVLSSNYWYPQFYFLRHTFNQRHFPTRGTVINARGRILNSIDREIATHRMIRTFGTYYVDAKGAIPLSQRVTLIPSAMLAGTFVFRSEDVASNHISQQQKFYQGGLFQVPFLNQTPFVGLLFMQKSGLYAANAQLNLQYNMFNNFFLTGRIGALKSENSAEDMFDFSNTLFGVGLTASLNTRLGPIGITVHGSQAHGSQSRDPLGVFVNFGFWF
ncbi:MAG: patatin-like phospholipase family protein [Bacteroidales bacterium]|nr:patatin-like phospholipase family protein [Bacteroidales bacterium]